MTSRIARHKLHQVDAINFAELPKSMGTISFVFCINFLLLPIERSMHRHAPFKKILYLSFGGVTCWILAFGILAYALFEEETCMNVLFNLNLEHRGAKMGGTALKLALCIAQITSYPLTMVRHCTHVWPCARANRFLVCICVRSYACVCVLFGRGIGIPSSSLSILFFSR